MARNNKDNKKQVSSGKEKKGDTSRTSNQRRKEASGGSTNTNNQGRPKGVDRSRL